MIGFGTRAARGEDDFRPRTVPYQREIAYQRSIQFGTLKDVPFLEVFGRITKLTLNLHAAGGYAGLRDKRPPVRVLTRSLTDYGAPALSPDRRSVAFFDYVQDKTPEGRSGLFHYRASVYDLKKRKSTVVFDVVDGQTGYHLWLSDSTLFVESRKTTTQSTSFSWVLRDGTVIHAMTVPIAVAIVDDAAVAYTHDGHRYLRYDRSTGETPWFHCDAQTEFLEYSPPKLVRVARFDAGKPPTERPSDFEVKVPCEQGCVARAGWSGLPRALGCTVEEAGR